MHVGPDLGLGLFACLLFTCLFVTDSFVCCLRVCCCRFEIQCANPKSKLWSSTPPRRLNEDLFNEAAEGPLEEIYDAHHTALKKIPSAKVLKVMRWKLRKHRANLVKKVTWLVGWLWPLHPLTLHLPPSPRAKPSTPLRSITTTASTGSPRH